MAQTMHPAYLLLVYSLLMACTSTLAAQRTSIGNQPRQREQQLPIATLTLPAAIPHDVSVWGDMPHIAELKVFNPRETAGEAEVRIQIIPPNGRNEARSREFAAPIVVVSSGWNTYTATDLFKNIDLEWFDGDRRVMSFSDTLPEGQYRLHISLRPRTPADSISPTGASGAFTAVDLARPLPATPAYTWDTGSPLPESAVFAWQYPAEVLLPGFQWIVRIAEVPGNVRIPIDIGSLPVLMERVVNDSTRLHIANPASYFLADRRYVWSVRPYNSGLDTDEWPQPVVFTLPAAKN